MARKGYVYILASKYNGTLYIGVTNDLARRLEEHRSESAESFVSKYKVFNLVYYEEYDLVEDAIYREKAIKDYSRERKIHLIVSINPEWRDLSGEYHY